MVEEVLLSSVIKELEVPCQDVKHPCAVQAVEPSVYTKIVKIRLDKSLTRAMCNFLAYLQGICVYWLDRMSQYGVGGEYPKDICRMYGL